MHLSKRFNYRRNTIVPNASYGIGVHECDVLVANAIGYCTEIEIKRSRSDLLADFKKKHTHDSVKIKYLYFAIPEELYDGCWKDIPFNAGIITVARKRSGKGLTTQIRRSSRLSPPQAHNP